MDNRMDDTGKTEVNKEPKNKTIPVTYVGWVCVYCGCETESPCCGEMHREIGYETIENNPELILESELTELYVIIDE